MVGEIGSGIARTAGWRHRRIMTVPIMSFFGTVRKLGFASRTPGTAQSMMQLKILTKCIATSIGCEA
jgi:hypothetical protein